jgi:hypothetical protein
MNENQHFLLTRFNVRVNYDSKRSGINPDWLSHRFDLFERFCYPSVRAQTNSNFKWLVYFDSDTPAFFKEKISQYAKWKNFFPIYIDAEFCDQLNREVVSRFVEEQTEYLITTRIDNDDAVCKNFIQLIQDHSEKKEFEFLSFLNGYVLDTGKLYSFKYVNNPFISLVEKIGSSSANDFKTILCGEHSQLSTLGNIKRIDTDAVWLQVVHGKNISNRIRGIRQPIQKLLDNRFSIDTIGLPLQDNFLPYWLDKSWSLFKQPLELIADHLPSNLKASIKKNIV